MRKFFGTMAVALALPAMAAADGARFYDYDGSFEDAAFAVETAIVGEGLVIDFVSHVGDMLNRTQADVGGTVKLYENANIFLFCSAVVSRKVMEADPANIAHCPYGIFVTEAGDGSGAVQIGYREMPKGPMQDVEALLEKIVGEAMGG
ncbi:MAG: DUF302 domain-containing protein [Pseudomonadota bacterium]